MTTGNAAISRNAAPEGPGTRAQVLVVIVNYKSAELTLECVRSVAGERPLIGQLQVVVVENDSGEFDTLSSALAEHEFAPWVSITQTDRNGGFAFGCNRGIQYADEHGIAYDWVLFLNPDTRVYPGAIANLVEFLGTHPQVGIGGSGLDLADGTPWPIAFRFPSVWSEVERGISFKLVSRLLRRHVVAQQMSDQPAEIDWVPGASMMVRREVLEQVGGMDEGFFLYFEETDFCRRARSAGWSCWYVPQSRVLHIAGQSTGLTAKDRKPQRIPSYWFESRRRYFLKHHGKLYATATDAAFILSRLIGRVKHKLRGGNSSEPPGFLRDLLSHSPLWPKNRSVSPPQSYQPAHRAPDASK